MLDDRSRLLAHDPDDMLRRIAEQPEQYRLAWDRASRIDLPADLRDVDSVAIFGMGGSAIGGDLVRCLTEVDTRVPIVVVRDYVTPSWVNKRTLAIAASFSGGTEETIEAMRGALAVGAKLLAFTGGGPLGAAVRAAGGTVVPAEYDALPRAAIAHLFIPILQVLGRLGLIADRSNEIDSALESLVRIREGLVPDVPVSQNLAKQLADFLGEGLPVFVSGGHLSAVGARWKGQVNENAKGWAVFEPLPEMNHNAVVGFSFPVAVRDQSRVVFLDSPLLHPRIRRRATATATLLDEAGIGHLTVAGEGQSRLADQLSLIHIGDWVSYYLAALRGVDPTPIDPIVRLKEILAQEA